RKPSRSNRSSSQETLQEIRRAGGQELIGVARTNPDCLQISWSPELLLVFSGGRYLMGHSTLSVRALFRESSIRFTPSACADATVVVPRRSVARSCSHRGPP